MRESRRRAKGRAKDGVGARERRDRAEGRTLAILVKPDRSFNSKPSGKAKSTSTLTCIQSTGKRSRASALISSVSGFAAARTSVGKLSLRVAKRCEKSPEITLLLRCQRTSRETEIVLQTDPIREENLRVINNAFRALRSLQRRRKKRYSDISQ